MKGQILLTVRGLHHPYGVFWLTFNRSNISAVQISTAVFGTFPYQKSVVDTPDLISWALDTYANACHRDSKFQLPFIHIYNTALPVHAFCDGAQFSHITYSLFQFSEKYKSFVPIKYNSHKLTSAELHLSQIEVEALSLMFVLSNEKFWLLTMAFYTQMPVHLRTSRTFLMQRAKQQGGIYF